MINLTLSWTLIFCSLSIILMCAVIKQVRTERTELHMRMREIEKILDKIEKLLGME